MFSGAGMDLQQLEKCQTHCSLRGKAVVYFFLSTWKATLRGEPQYQGRCCCWRTWPFCIRQLLLGQCENESYRNGGSFERGKWQQRWNECFLWVFDFLHYAADSLICKMAQVPMVSNPLQTLTRRTKRGRRISFVRKFSTTNMMFWSKLSVGSVQLLLIHLKPALNGTISNPGLNTLAHVWYRFLTISCFRSPDASLELMTDKIQMLLAEGADNKLCLCKW